MHAIPLGFVRRKVAGGGRRGLGAPLNLTSMIDFLLVVVIFLLSTFSASGEQNVPKDVHLPNAHHVQALLTAPMVSVAGRDVYVDSRPAGTVVEALDAMTNDAARVPKLGDLEAKLKFMKETWQSTHPADVQFPGVVVLQLDENVPAFVAKSIFYTCALSGYPNVSFLVNKKASR